jgi:O-methyltransferase involved in polyketide biosynthesis
MARNPVAQTAFGPMVLAAVEHNEPPGRRLVDDDLAELFLPAPMRLLAGAALDFERDDLLTSLAEHGYRTDYRAFFICEGVTQYLTEDGVRRTLEGLRAAAPGSRFVFTYVRRDFIDGSNRYGTRTLYRNVRERHQLWHFGLQPEEVAGFIGEYGWRLAEQAGPDDLVQRYVRPAGRKLEASQLEWSAYAEKT